MPLQAPVFNKDSLLMISQSELSRRTDPTTGRLYELAEVLAQSNDILGDMPLVEGNMITGHKFAVRTSLPTAYWKRFNQGVPSSKSSMAVSEVTCGMCEARSIIDADLLDLNGNSAAFRASEDEAFIETMNQKITEAIFYGDVSHDAEGFDGLTKIYHTIDPKKDDTAKNVIDCGGTGDDLQSIWIVGWNNKTIYGMYPKGSTVGLTAEDRGKQRVLDPNGNPYEAYETIFKWRFGLVVQDWRYAVRLCNISVKDVMAGRGLGTGNIKDADTNNLILALTQALCKFPTQTSANLAMYMSPDMHAAINVVASRSNTQVVQLQEGTNTFGTHTSWQTFNGVPMRRVDVLGLHKEQQVM